jgi:hypothetical protein
MVITLNEQGQNRENAEEDKTVARQQVRSANKVSSSTVCTLEDKK